MIRAIKIQNFQSHKDTKLELSDGVNAIIGVSDSGKTAIFRALRWVVENRPSGQDFHSWWKGDPSITIQLDDGTEITRERIKSENIYRVNETTLKAFGQRVPDEVQKALNFAPINFQWQMDSSFLLSQSSGEVSRYLNGVVNLEDIDRALGNIEKRVRAEIRAVQGSKQAIEKYEADISSYDWLAGVEPQLLQVEGLDKEVGKLTSGIMCLSGMLDGIGFLERKVKPIEKILQFKGEVEELLNAQQEVARLESQCLFLDNFLDDIDEAEEELEKVSALLKFEGQLNKLLDLLGEVEGLETDTEELSESLHSLDTLKGDISLWEGDLKRLNERYDSLMPEICPLCGQSIKKSRRGN